MLTLEQAKSLRHGQVLLHSHLTNGNGTPQRWRVNGKVKTWKRSPDRVQVPVKRGLYGYGYLTESNRLYFTLA